MSCVLADFFSPQIQHNTYKFTNFSLQVHKSHFTSHRLKNLHVHIFAHIVVVYIHITVHNYKFHCYRCSNLLHSNTFIHFCSIHNFVCSFLAWMSSVLIYNVEIHKK